MKLILLILLALTLSGCIYGMYPRHGEIEIREGGGGGEHHEQHPDFEEHRH